MSQTPGIVTVTFNPAIDQTVFVPGFRADAVNRVTAAQAHAGGKGVNVAAFLAEAGCRVSATGFLGDANPTLFERLFQQKQIGDRFIRVPGETRVNIKIVDEKQGQVTDLNLPGLTASADAVAQLEGAIAHLTTDHDWFVLSGSLPEGLPPTIYHDLIQALKAQGKTVVLDTSGKPLHAALFAAHPTHQPDLIKPNVAELEGLLGLALETDAAVVKAAQDLVATGIKTVVVSMGAQGAWFVTADQAIYAQPPAVTVKSTVGAGDAMVAGAVAALTEGRSLAACATLATAFSMGALTQIGPQLPPMADIQANGDRVILRTG